MRCFPVYESCFLGQAPKMQHRVFPCPFLPKWQSPIKNFRLLNEREYVNREELLPSPWMLRVRNLMSWQRGVKTGSYRKTRIVIAG